MIRQISNQELDKFLFKQKYSQFLQSSSWNEFEKSLGNNVWQIGLFASEDMGSDILAVASIVEKKMPFGLSYLYCPRGPIVLDTLDELEKNKCLKTLLKSFRDISIKTKTYREVFGKFEPNFRFEKLKHVNRVSDYQPSHTWILDLKKSEEELLFSMHQKTRYNINLAKKRGISVEMSKNKEDVEHFIKLINETSKRDKFIPHSDSYYRKMLQLEAGGACLWLAKHDGKVIASNIVMAFGDTVTYTHGASSNEYRNLMAPHLLQWEEIKWAKREGYDVYDFWGIAKDDNEDDKWHGFTRFKKGFGGNALSFSGTYDLVFNNGFYKLYNFYKKIRNII